VNYTQRALEDASERLYSFYQAVRAAASMRDGRFLLMRDVTHQLHVSVLRVQRCALPAPRGLPSGYFLMVRKQAAVPQGNTVNVHQAPCTTANACHPMPSHAGNAGVDAAGRTKPYQSVTYTHTLRDCRRRSTMHGRR